MDRGASSGRWREGISQHGRPETDSGLTLVVLGKSWGSRAGTSGDRAFRGLRGD